jgi:hypothetical protein
VLSKLIADIQIKYFTKNVLIDEAEYEDQLNFLNSFREPESDFNRTYYQHCCQMRHVNRLILFLLDFASMLALPFFSLYLLFKGIGFRKGVPQNPDSIVFLNCVNGKAIYPEELLKKYSEVIETDFFDGKALFPEDLFFVLRFIKRYPFSCWLSLRLLYRVAVFRYTIQKYYPKAIVVTGEVNPSGATITLFCEKHNIGHINLLSGERFFEISASFVHFHKFYVWDEHYIKVFMKLRADKRNEYIVHTPAALKIDLVKNRIENKVVDFTYYLGIITEIQAKELSELIGKISSYGYSIRLRPHHRWTDMNLLNRYIRPVNIEDNKELSIEESVASANAVIGSFTTVLLQSVMSGREVIVDDVIYSEKFIKLKMLDYIIHSKPHKKLSEVLSSMTNKIKT